MTRKSPPSRDIVKKSGHSPGRKRSMSKGSGAWGEEAGVGASSATEGPSNSDRGSARHMDIVHKMDMAGDAEDHVGAELKGLCEEPKLCKEDQQETRHLKELLLLHLDLIQQQQELLVSKDRQIQTLLQEKDTLKCRLDRMARRMSLMKQRDVVDMSPSHEPSPGIDRKEHRGIKRKYSLEPQNLEKRFRTPTESDEYTARARGIEAVTLNKVTPSKQRSRIPRHLHTTSTPAPGRTDEAIDSDDKEVIFRGHPSEFKPKNSITPGKVRGLIRSSWTPKSIKKNTEDSDSEDDISRIRKLLLEKSEKVKQRSQMLTSDECIQWTPKQYFVPDDRMPCDISPRKVCSTDYVEVPVFQVKPVPVGYQMEGTENITDEAYIKRHQKPEVDEKRRKRWDQQRTRELSQYQKLQQRQNKLGQPGQPTPQLVGASDDDDSERFSFQPDPENAKFLEVSSSVPVSAFGYPLPLLPEEDFELPWFDLDRRDREDNKFRGRSRKK